MRHPIDVRQLVSIALAAAGLSLVACAPGPGHGHHDPPGPPVYGELEPNDSPFHADFLGGVDRLSHFFVEGHVETAYGYDRYDHFELVADEPVTIDFWLEAWNHYADIDLCLVDPDTGDVIACYDSPWDTESGSFSLDWPGRRVVLLVETYGEDTSYSLEIAGAPPYYGPAAGEGDGADLRPLSGLGISFPRGVPTPHKERDGDPAGARADG